MERAHNILTRGRHGLSRQDGELQLQILTLRLEGSPRTARTGFIQAAVCSSLLLPRYYNRLRRLVQSLNELSEHELEMEAQRHFESFQPTQTAGWRCWNRVRPSP
jgi:hypothetical protein